MSNNSSYAQQWIIDFLWEVEMNFELKAAVNSFKYLGSFFSGGTAVSMKMWEGVGEGPQNFGTKNLMFNVRLWAREATQIRIYVK